MFVGMRKRMGTFVAVIAGLLAVGMIVPMFLERSSGSAQGSGLTVAKVDGRRITELELSREFAWQYYERMAFGGLRPDQLDSIRSTVMDKLIDDAAILNAAKKANYAPDQAAVDSQVKSDRANFENDSDWVSALSRWGFTTASYSKWVADRQMVEGFPRQAVGAVEATEDEIKAEFERMQKSQPKLVLDEVRTNLDKMIRLRKEKELRDKYLSDLRAQAKVKIYDSRVLAYRAMEAKEYDEAVKQYRKAAKLQPGDPYLQVALGRALALQGKAKDSVAAFEKATKIVPTDPYVVIAQADANRDAGDADQAVELYKRASELADKDVFAHALIADGYRKMDRADDASAEDALMADIQLAQKEAAQKALDEAKAEAEKKAANDASAQPAIEPKK